MIALDTQTLAKAWPLYQFSWGFSTVPATGTADERDAEMLVYAQSLCNAIAADGKASDTEIAWVQGYLANKGFGNLVHEVEAMAKAAESKTVDQMVADTKKAMDVGSLKFAGPAVIFDSIRAAMVDGLDDKEWAPLPWQVLSACPPRRSRSSRSSPWRRRPSGPRKPASLPPGTLASMRSTSERVRRSCHRSQQATRKRLALGEKTRPPRVVFVLGCIGLSSKFSQGKIVV